MGVVLSFSVNKDPEVLLRKAEDAERPLAEKVERVVDRFVNWMETPLSSFPCGSGGVVCDCSDALMTPRQLPYPPSRYCEFEPEAEAAPSLAMPVVADWAFRL